MGNKLDKTDRSQAPVFGNNNGGVTKAGKYSWSDSGQPGRFEMIDKYLLNIDDNYQRDATSEEIVLRIAREWKWPLFETLMVCQRPDGTYWVFAGGHRSRASFYRADIRFLPCLVFAWDDISEEAKSFIQGARQRSTISAQAAYRAMVVAGDDVAVRTAKILVEHGVSVEKTAKRSGTLKCIGAVLKAVKENELLAGECLALCLHISDDKPISSELFRGLSYLCNHFRDNALFAEIKPSLLNLTAAEINRSIRQLKAETGKGGEAIEALAIMNLLNKGKRTRKLEW